MPNVSLILYCAGALSFLGASVVLQRNRAKLFDAAFAVFVMTGLAAWQGLLAWNALEPLPGRILIDAEIARAGLLLLYMHRMLRTAAGRGLAPAAIATAVVFALVVPALIGSYHPGIAEDSTRDFVLSRGWSGVFISVGLLIALEQVLRNSEPPLVLVRYTCLALGVTVAYDLYLFADTLIFERLDPDSWRARGGVNAIAAMFLAVTVSRSRIARAISISRNIVYYTASITIAGLFLLTISIVGTAMRETGGTWGAVLRLMLLFGAILFIVAGAVSSRYRDLLRVYIAKNFFTLRYDYRAEWLRLIDRLTGKDGEVNLYVRAIQVLADLYKCPGGVLWLRQDGDYLAVAPCRMKLPEDCSEPAHSEFCSKLAEGWIFDLQVDVPSSVRLPALPGWVARVPDVGIIVPLLVEDELTGFVGLQRSLGFSELTWEDLDILKTAARQVASYIAHQQAAEQLSRARQFDTYHQLTAFIMHDLKNLIAQQELVVKNAARHKDNPAFVEDAIETIQNSVARMSALLGKLQQREPSTRRPLALQQILVDAIGKCQTLKPKPSLRIERTGLRVLSDHDHLVMILSHIIKNAQEATREDGFVDVTLGAEAGFAVVEVEDNGVGMDAEFLRARLFKPFESTKTGKGMGIGAFQAREFIRSLGGEVSVRSVPGAGSTFKITIPLADVVSGEIMRGVAH